MIKLPNFFSDGMVIRPDACIWGISTPGQTVEIRIADKYFEAVADDNGKFLANLCLENGGPYEMRIGARVISEVYVGRVWLCGGQSNMETPINRVTSLLHDYIADDERIRFFQVEKNLRFDGPADDVNGHWQTATGDVLHNMFAVPYFFAKELLKDNPSPIGLINIAAGGTPIEGWLPEEIIGHDPRLEEAKQPGFVENATKKIEADISCWHEKLAKCEGWHLPSYDDSGWESRMLLDHASLSHGLHWYRTKFSLNSIDGEFTLNLGRAQDSVQVYINGHEVVSVGYQYPPCYCTVPAGVLQKDENMIAVRLLGETQRPKFIPGKKYELCGPNTCIDLSGLWKHKVGCEMPPAPADMWFYDRPCGVYNYMLAPVLGLVLDGILWYQGESNIGRPEGYAEKFIQFVQHVRSKCGDNLPVIFTQLANYIDPNGNGENWAALREEQKKCLSLPNTAMAVTIDCGEYNDLHPQDKKTVATRLALHARKLAYKADIVADGPVAKRTKIRRERLQTWGGQLEIIFENAQGLWAKNGRVLLDKIDAHGHVSRVYATVEGEALIVDLDENVEIIRYGWTDCPAVVLYNAYGLPASPFVMEIATTWDLNLPSLAQAFSKHFMLGNIWSIFMYDHNTRDMFVHHYNAVTAENDFKPEYIAPGGHTRPAANDFDFTETDDIVDWVVENNIALIGHTLVWHGQSPPWLYESAPGVPLTRQQARANMEFYISTIAEHYNKAGKLEAFYSWDVVNEAMASDGGIWAGDWRMQMRTNSPWYLAYANGLDAVAGEDPSDYMYDAFVFARRYFPHSVLYYNDYNEELPPKREAIAQMVEQINERFAHDFENNIEAVPAGQPYNGRLLIEGIGLQSHFHLDQWVTNQDNIPLALERFAKTGAVLSVTELDITIGHKDIIGEPYPLSELDQQRLAEAYARTFGYYLQYADYIERVSIWGKADHQSWRAWGQPLLFDMDLQPKTAFFAVLEQADSI